MSHAAPIPRIAYADYLAAEERAEVKHEFVRGEVFAMAGGTPEHGALAANVIALLVAGVRGARCRVFSSDVRVRIEAADAAVYPDASVVCDALERADDDPNAIVNPVVLVEVLSDSTEAYDRGDKTGYYRSIPSVREILLVSQRAPKLELYRREDAGRWVFLEAGAGDTLKLASLDVALPVDDIYRDPLRD
jgi:Uma2 family endonuclease